MRRPAPLFAALLAPVLLLAVASWCRAAPLPAPREGQVVVVSAAARLVLGRDGRASSLVQLPGGRELLRRTDLPFVVIHAGGATLPAASLEASDGQLLFGFADVRYAVTLRIDVAGSELLVGLDEVRGPDVAAVEFVRLAPSVDENVGSILAVRWDSDVSLALVGTRDTVETVSSRNGLMIASAYADPGLAGAAAAIVVGSSDRFAPRMADAERTLGLPSPRLGGRWAKESDAARRSYLFVDLTEANADEVIRWARLGGLDTVLVYVRTWAASAGTYAVNRTSFPGGEASLAATVRRLHDAGLRVGMHMLTSLVARNDPLAVPRPDARLLRDASGQLVVRHGAYLADLRTTLATDIAERIAGLVDRVGFDMIYMDAGEVNDVNGPFWYWGGRQQEEILRRVQRPLLVQGSGTTAWTWHWFTRGTCDDGVAVGRDAWLEVQKIGRALPVYRRNRMPAELGWWPLHDAAPGRAATTPDEAWRLGEQLLALDVPVSVETTVASLRANPDSDEILRTLARFESVRLGGGAPPAARPAGARAASTASSTARYATTPLLDTSAPAVALPVPGAASPAGVLAWRIALEQRASAPRRWVAALGGPAAGVDLSQYVAIAVTLEVSGPAANGRAVPVLNVQLETPGPRYRDHLVDLDFRGERTVVIEGTSADRVVRELSPAPGTYPLKSSLLDADLRRTVALNLRWMRGGDAGLVVRVVAIEARLAPVDAAA